MVKVLILGSTGMLGNAVHKHFTNAQNFDVYTTYRNEKFKTSDNKSLYFDALNQVDDFSSLPKCDYYINCIGTIKPFMNTNIVDSIYTNSIFPHKLANHCENNNIKLIHITTDCVFSGKDGNYNENSLHDCLDDYGKSKSLGEPKNCMVIRTSIIGEEIHKNASLIEWVKTMKNKDTNGFTNHLWNGVTTNHYAELCEKIINNDLYKKELFHVHSNIVNKYELLHFINERFKLNMNINPIETKEKVDRSLSTVKNLCSELEVKSLYEQIMDI